MKHKTRNDMMINMAWIYDALPIILQFSVFLQVEETSQIRKSVKHCNVSFSHLNLVEISRML